MNSRNSIHKEKRENEMAFHRFCFTKHFRFDWVLVLENLTIFWFVALTNSMTHMSIPLFLERVFDLHRSTCCIHSWSIRRVPEILQLRVFCSLFVSVRLLSFIELGWRFDFPDYVVRVSLVMWIFICAHTAFLTPISEWMCSMPVAGLFVQSEFCIRLDIAISQLLLQRRLYRWCAPISCQWLKMHSYTFMRQEVNTNYSRSNRNAVRLVFKFATGFCAPNANR